MSQPIILNLKTVLQMLPTRTPESHKGSYGKVLAVCGSSPYRGAAVLSVMGALRTGAGLVTLAAPECVVAAAAARVPEAIFLADAAQERILEEVSRSEVCLLGCGLSADADTAQLAKKALDASMGVVVLDAGALCSLADDISAITAFAQSQPLIVTPHPGEMARLTGLSIAEIQGNRLETARRFAQETGLITVLKGAGTLTNFMKLPAVMMGDAEAYMRIVGLFLFTNGVMQVFTQIFNCNGRTEIGMLIFFFINVVNILGNYLFLFGPLENLGFGVKGVAISTSISNGVGLVISVIAFIFIIKGRISLKYFRPFPKAMLFKLIKLGIPTAGENISYNISQICITIFVNLLGPLAITTKIYCNILCNFSIVYSSSVAGAASIITGHAVGRGDYDYAYKRVMKTLFWAMLISMAIAGCNLLLSPFTFRLFTDNQDVIKLGFNIMLIGLFLEFGRTSNLVIIQSMRAAGDVVFPTVLGIFSMWGISVLFSWIFTRFFNFGLPGVWIAMAMDEIFRGIVVFIRWQRGTWRGKSVVRQ